MGYGFQTPPAVADAMMRMAASDTGGRLQNGVGDEYLVSAAKSAFPAAEITSVESDAEYC